MPLLGATGAIADHICANCGNERHLTSNAWVLHDEDDSVFSTPPCTCGATETFAYHDWIYMGEKRRPRDLPPEEKFDMTPEPDHTHHGAEQMVLIERIAQAKGRKQKKHPEKSKTPYKDTPKAPKQDKVRAHVAEVRGR